MRNPTSVPHKRVTKVMVAATIKASRRGSAFTIRARSDGVDQGSLKLFHLSH